MRILKGYLFLIVLFGLFTSCYSTQKKSYLGSGVWKTNCNSFASLNIIKDSIFIVLNSSQIYIKATAVKSKTKKSAFDLLLLRPDDLGPGGIRLNWGDFSRDSIIGQINYDEKEEIMFFDWLGFYDENLNHRIWENDSEFQIETKKKKNIELQKCN